MASWLNKEWFLTYFFHSRRHFYKYASFWWRQGHFIGAKKRTALHREKKGFPQTKDDFLRVTMSAVSYEEFGLLLHSRTLILFTSAQSFHQLKVAGWKKKFDFIKMGHEVAFTTGR